MLNLSSLLVLICIVARAQAPVEQPGRIYISKDQGVNWAKADNGFPISATINVWVRHDTMVIAGTNANGIYISSDQLKSWHPSSKGLPKNIRIISITSFKQLLFIGTYTKGIFISTDDGTSWQPSNSGLGNFTVRCFNANGQILLAGTNDGIYSSSNNGNVWTLQKSGLQINDFESAAGQLFAATNLGVLNSKDYGNSWDWIFSDGAIFEIAVRENEIFAKDFSGTVFRSPLATISWLKADLYLPPQYNFRLTPASRKFLTAKWETVYSNNLIRYNYNNGLPVESAFTEMLATPYGLIAAAALPGILNKHC